SQNGTTNTSKRAIVMTATAIPRIFHSRRCTCIISGQVATTSVVAQMTAGRNGRNIQKQAPINPATNSTARVVRVRSDRPSIGPRRLAQRSRFSPSPMYHQLQPVAVRVAEIDAAVLARAAGDGHAVPLQLGLEGLVGPRRHIEGEMVEVIAGRQRGTSLLEQRHPLLPGVQKYLLVILAMKGHAEHVGVELRALHVVDVQNNMVNPTGLDHRFLLLSTLTISLLSAKAPWGISPSFG